MHIRTWCYAVLCLFLPITLPAQKEHKYLDHALPEAWQENDSDFQQTLPVDDQWWKNFNDPTLDSLIEVAVKQNYSVLMAVDRIAMAKANLRIQQGSYSPTLGLAAGWTRQQSSGHTSNLPQTITQYSDAALSMNWEIDVFGSIRNRVKAQKDNSLTYEIAPAISWNFFQGTKLAQATRLAKAQLDESIRQFNQDVLTAVQEVDNAMNFYKNSIKQIVALREVVNQGKQTLELSLDLYKQGLTPFQNVLDAQRSLLSYENELTQARGSSLLSLIQLYQALGSGWEIEN